MFWVEQNINCLAAHTHLLLNNIFTEPHTHCLAQLLYLFIADVISHKYLYLSYDSLALILLQSTGIVPKGSLQRTQIKICITFQCHMTKLSLKSTQKIRISSCASREKSVSTPVHHARNPYQPLCITRAALLGPRGRDRRARRGSYFRCCSRYYRRTDSQSQGQEDCTSQF